MKPYHWKLYYVDDTVFSSDDGTWEEAPDDGILYAVVWFDKFHDTPTHKRRYRRIANGMDYYFWHEGTLCCNNDTLEVNKERYPSVTHYKRGMWTGDAHFEEVYERIDNTLLPDEEVL